MQVEEEYVSLYFIVETQVRETCLGTALLAGCIAQKKMLIALSIFCALSRQCPPSAEH